MTAHRRDSLLALVPTLVGFLLFFLLDHFLTASVWQHLFVPPATMVYFCETTLVDHFIRQPANTYTNLGYLFVAALIFFRSRRLSPDSFLAHHKIYAYLYALLACYTFVGSSFFHATLSLFAEQLDLSAVYGIAALPLVFTVHHYLHLRGVRVNRNALLGVWGMWFVAASIWTWEMKAHWVIPALVGVTAVLLGLGQGKNPHPAPLKLVGSLGLCILGGLTFFIFDIARVGCYPDAWLHPHGCWHLCAAGGAWVFFRYMASLRSQK